MEKVNDLTEAPKHFVKESIELLDRCAKPSRREFIQISQAVAVGFFIMGFIGYFVKLVHIPINNIIVGGA
ncbi:secE/sec61-gamma protein [Neoconidiobolus thromboides FSU 785]|nr:secE/sec61-gamma protein [Neoconidiobolus thromboides FSU 785]